MWLKVVGDSPALDGEGTLRGSTGIDEITFENDCVVTRPGDSERSRKSRNAASGDDEFHWPKVSSQGDGRQAALVLQRSNGRATPQTVDLSHRPKTRVLPCR